MTTMQDSSSTGDQVSLDLAAPPLQEQIAKLTRELEAERSYRRQLEKDSQKLRRTHWAYKSIDDLYKAIKRDAEYDAQAPIDEHYRDVLAILATIASSESSCTCHLRNWQGEGHDIQCPIRIATEAHPSLYAHRLLAKAGAT